MEDSDVKEYQIRKRSNMSETEANDKKEPENLSEEDIHIREMGTLPLEEGHAHRIELLTVIGEVEGHEAVSGNTKATKYEHLLPKLAQIENSEEVDGVLILLNTLGGDVEAGLAIAEMIASLSKPTVSLVLGGCHSIGGPLAVSADYSFVAKTATMTLHPIRTSGTLITAEPTFEYMKKTQERVVDFIVEHSHASKGEIEEKMNCTDNMANDVGTLLFGPEAVEMGLIDSLGSLTDALGKLRSMIGEK